MAWELTIADNGNRTGATVTVTAGSVASYDLQRAEVEADTVGSFATVSNGSGLTGDQTIRVTGLGYYRWRVVTAGTSTVLAPTTPAGFLNQAVTAEGDSVYERCLQMIRDRICGLSLQTVEGNDVGVFIRQAGSLINVSFPAIILAIAGEAEEDLGGSNNKDDIGYPVVIYIAENSAWDADERRARHLHWRHRIHRRIHNVPRFDLRVPEVSRCSVRTGPVIDVRGSSEGYTYRTGSLLVTCVATEYRNTA